MSKYVLAFDSGTTSVRCVLVNRLGRVVKMTSRHVPLNYPHPGWVEQDPMALITAQKEALEEILIDIDVQDIDSIGITNQRETLVVWDKDTHQPIYPAINWQSRQTKDICEQWKKYEKRIKAKTGLTTDPYFSASKLRFILDKFPNLNRENLRVGTVDTWLLYQLSKGEIYASDYTNASRMMIFNIHDLRWDTELIELLGFEGITFPEVYPSSHYYGDLEIQGKRIGVHGVAGDQQASLFGHGCFDEGEMKCTYGTGAFVLMNTGTTPIINDQGLITTLACSLNGKACYALEGSIFIAGALMKWLVEKLHLAKNVFETSQLAYESEADEELVFVPAFTGLGAPHWQPKARGTILGIKASTTPEQIIKAGLEAIAFQTFDVIEAMNKDIVFLSVDGKASENDYLIQFQAGLLNTPIIKWKSSEQTALGVSFLSGLHTGFFGSLEQLRAGLEKQKVIHPTMDAHDRQLEVRKWQKAVQVVIEATGGDD